MRLYDIVVLVTPDLNDEDATKVATEYKKILTDGGANVVKDEPWGKRRLAFPIQRKREAHYHYWQVEASPAAVAEAERLRIKAAKRPPRPAAPPAPPVESAPAERSES